MIAADISWALRESVPGLGPSGWHMWSNLIPITNPVRQVLSYFAV